MICPPSSVSTLTAWPLNAGSYCRVIITVCAGSKATSAKIESFLRGSEIVSAPKSMVADEAFNAAAGGGPESDCAARYEIARRLTLARNTSLVRRETIFTSAILCRKRKGKKRK